MLEYKDHPGSPFEEHRFFEIREVGSDYALFISDGKTELHFRYCISGGFEHSHPKTTAAISALHRAFVIETQQAATADR